MPLQDLTSPPTAPSRSDPPDLFIERADDFVAWFDTFVGEMQTLAAQLEATAALIAAAPAYADPGLVALTDLTPAADRLAYFNGSATSALATFTAAARSLLDDTTVDAMLTTLGLSANGKSLVTAADYAAMRTLLGLVIGTNVQAYDAELAALAGLTSAADKGIQFTGSGTAGLFDLTAFAKTLLDDANAPAALTTLGAQASLTVTSNGNGLAIGITISGTTYYFQWGRKTASANGSTAATFPVPFTDASKVSVTKGGTSNIDNDAQDNAADVQSGSITTTGFTIWSASDSSTDFSWMAAGY